MLRSAGHDFVLGGVKRCTAPSSAPRLRRVDTRGRRNGRAQRICGLLAGTTALTSADSGILRAIARLALRNGGR